MIYKKFQIPCPLPNLGPSTGNLTFNGTALAHVVLLPNGSESTNVNFLGDLTQHGPAELTESQARGSGVEFEAQSDSKCQPKYFVFNSRVRESLAKQPVRPGSCSGHWGCSRVGKRTARLTLVFQTAYAIPILAFAFVCHPEVLPIYSELRE